MDLQCVVTTKLNQTTIIAEYGEANDSANDDDDDDVDDCKWQTCAFFFFSSSLHPPQLHICALKSQNDNKYNTRFSFIRVDNEAFLVRWAMQHTHTHTHGETTRRIAWENVECERTLRAEKKTERRGLHCRRRRNNGTTANLCESENLLDYSSHDSICCCRYSLH